MKIENMRKINKGTLKAFFDVDLVKVKIKSCKLVQQDGQAAWITGPDEKYEVNGETKYRKLVEFADKDLQARILAAALEEYEQ